MKEPDRKIDALTENETQKLLNFVKADCSSSPTSATLISHNSETLNHVYTNI